MRNRPLSVCREEKKGRKGAWRPYFCNWLLHSYFKKTLGISIDVRMLHMRNRPLSDCREEKKGRKGAWRPYFCNWLLHPCFKKILGFPLTSECCTCGTDLHRTAERKRKAEKGHGGHISAIGYYTHILKKSWDFH
jgi:hypothetical protein